ncbi:MAG TPA: chemotaxis protein CheW [Syntrophomonadaceae bacterium]|nr:chemotaxis protein CheW [Syntrophomonadaceae bacterium]
MKTENVPSSAETQLVTFSLGDASFGINIMNVQAVIRTPAISQFPQCSFYVNGIISLSGQILPVIDARTKFGIRNGEITSSASRVLVVNVKGKNAGLNVDSVSEVLRVDSRSIEAVPASLSRDVDRSLITGVVKIHEDNKVIMILDVDSLCSMEHQTLEEAQSLLSDHFISSDTKAPAEEVQIVSFMIGQEEFGLEIDKVKKIIRFPEITKVLNAPQYIKGITSLDDTLMPIVDLSTKLGCGMVEITDGTRVVVVDLNGTMVGLTVDRVHEVRRIPNSMIFPPPQIIRNSTGGRVTGIARLGGGERIVMLLDPHDIISYQVIEEINKHEETSEEE